MKTNICNFTLNTFTIILLSILLLKLFSINLEIIILSYTLIVFIIHAFLFYKHGESLEIIAEESQKADKLKIGSIDIIFPTRHLVIDEVNNEITIKAAVKNNRSSSFTITGLTFDIIKTGDSVVETSAIKTYSQTFRYLNSIKNLYHVMAADNLLEFNITSDKKSPRFKTFSKQYIEEDDYKFNTEDIKIIKKDKEDQYPIIFIGKITYLDALGYGWRKTFRYRIAMSNIQLADVYVEQIYKSPT